jgi:hypothetical protein
MSSTSLGTFTPSHHTIALTHFTIFPLHHIIVTFDAEPDITLPVHHIIFTHSFELYTLLLYHHTKIAVLLPFPAYNTFCFHHKIVAFALFEFTTFDSQAIIVTLADEILLPFHHNTCPYTPHSTLLKREITPAVEGFTTTLLGVIYKFESSL